MHRLSFAARRIIDDSASKQRLGLFDEASSASVIVVSLRPFSRASLRLLPNFLLRLLQRPQVFVLPLLVRPRRRLQSTALHSTRLTISVATLAKSRFVEHSAIFFEAVQHRGRFVDSSRFLRFSRYHFLRYPTAFQAAALGLPRASIWRCCSSPGSGCGHRCSRSRTFMPVTRSLILATRVMARPSPAELFLRSAAGQTSKHNEASSRSSRS